jgi:four helix bundle protein
MSNPVTNNRIQDLKSNVRYRAFEFSKKILGFVQAFPNTKIYWVFQDQLLRSATSIGANLYEAKSASSKKDFMRYYEIGLRSGNESLYWLALLKQSDLVEVTEASELIKELKEITNMIASSLLTMRNKKR